MLDTVDRIALHQYRAEASEAVLDHVEQLDVQPRFDPAFLNSTAGHAPVDPKELGWMLLIQCRDESGLRRLHVEFESRMHRCALATVHREEIACEVVSASFLQVWTNAADYDVARGSVAAWLMLITRSRSFDALRHARVISRREVCLDDEDGAWEHEVAADAAAEPHTHLEQQRRRRRLDRALMKLSPMQRQVVSLTTMDGHSHDEASRYLGLPLGTVKSHAKRGLAALRHRLNASSAVSV